MRRLFLFFIGFLLLGCTSSNPTSSSAFTGNVPAATYVLPTETDLIVAISSLKTLQEYDLDTYTGYVEFGDRINTLIKIMNEKGGTKIPPFDTSVPGFKKTADFTTKIAPLANQYNQVILSAREAKSGSLDNIQSFRGHLAAFGLEAGLISAAVFYSVAYESVGIAYHAFGLESLAFKCGACVSAMLSAPHWAIRGAMVEASGGLAKIAVSINQTKVQTDADGLLNGANGLLSQGQNSIKSLVNGK